MNIYKNLIDNKENRLEFVNPSSNLIEAALETVEPTFNSSKDLIRVLLPIFMSKENIDGPGIFVSVNLETWDEYLSPLVFAYNTAVHATTVVKNYPKGHQM